MAFRHTILVICLLSVVAGCMGVKARYTYNDEIDFSELNTYAWEPGLHAMVDDPQYVDFYMESMQAKLASKGFELDSGSPDFLIRTHPPKKYKEVYLSIYGEKEFKKGMIAIEFIDTQSNEVIWEGVAEALLSEQPDPGKLKKIISEAVEDLLDGFPPTVKK